LSNRAAHPKNRAMSNDPRVLNDTGMAALARGDAAAAVRAFEGATAADPLASPLWLNLAKAHRLANNDNGERAALQRAIDNDQLDFMAQVRMAQLNERLGELSAAQGRWAGVLAMGSQMPQTPALTELLMHAQSFVQRRSAQLADSVEQQLGDWRSGLDEADRRRFGTALDVAVGRRRVFVNECAGIHYPFLPADEYFDRAHFDWLDRAEAATNAVRAEYLALADAMPDSVVPYVEQDAGTPENKWTALDGKRDWGAIYLWKYGKPHQAVLDACPATAALLANLPLANVPGRGPTAFFSILKPGKVIPPHTGVTNIRSIVHLPLVVPEGCIFRVGGETRHWREGEAWVFDDTIEHEARNESALPRAILIFDVWNPYLSPEECRLIGDFMRAADAAGFGPAQHD
jgi:aspartate beta-hydroxylase